MTKSEIIQIIALIVVGIGMFLLGLLIQVSWRISFCQGVWEGGRVVAEGIGKEVRFIN